MKIAIPSRMRLLASIVFLLTSILASLGIMTHMENIHDRLEHQGNWQIVGGNFDMSRTSARNGTLNLSLFQKLAWREQETPEKVLTSIDAVVKLEKDAVFTLLFRGDHENFYTFSFSANPLLMSGFFRYEGNRAVRQPERSVLQAQPQQWYHLRLQLQRSSFRAYQDQNLLATFEDPTFRTGFVGIGSFQEGVEIDAITIAGYNAPSRQPFVWSDHFEGNHASVWLMSTIFMLTMLSLGLFCLFMAHWLSQLLNIPRLILLPRLALCLLPLNFLPNANAQNFARTLALLLGISLLGMFITCLGCESSPLSGETSRHKPGESRYRSIFAIILPGGSWLVLTAIFFWPAPPRQAGLLPESFQMSREETYDLGKMMMRWERTDQNFLWEGEFLTGPDEINEIVFRKRKTSEAYEWYAFVISTNAHQPSGFAKIQDYDYRLIKPLKNPIPPDTWISLSIRAQSGIFSATIRTSASRSELEKITVTDRTIPWGSPGIIPITGAIKVRNLSITPLADDTWLLRSKAGQFPIIFILWLLAPLLYLWLVAKGDGLARQEAFRLDRSTYFALPWILLLWYPLNRLSPGTFSPHWLAILALIGIIVAKMMQQIKLFRNILLANLLLMLFSLSGIVAGEYLLRASPFFHISCPAPPSIIPDRSLFYYRDENSRRYNPYLNRYDFKNRRHSLAKPAGVYRIICLGSSSTWEPGGDDPSAYPQLLESRLNRIFPERVEVINAGVPGSTTLRERLFFQEVLQKFQPDLITINFGRNDFTTSFDISKERALYESSGQVTSPRARNILEFQHVFHTIQYYGIIHELIQFLFPSQARWGFSDCSCKNALQCYRLNLTELIEGAKSRGIEVLLIQEPQSGYVSKATIQNIAWQVDKLTVMPELARAYQLPLAPTLETFFQHRQDFLFRDDVHLTLWGRNLMAEIIAQTILAKKLIERKLWGTSVDQPRVDNGVQKAKKSL